jgi:hypothetical protein
MADSAPTKTSSGSGRALKLVLAFLLVIGSGIGLAFMGAGAMRPEVSETGLKFRVVKEGTGEPIAAADAALLDYVLTADDGAQPFTSDQVFPGFAEAMMRMREGGEYRFTMPPKLAFPDGATPPGIPKDTNLTFDVRVRKIARGGAAMMRQMQQEQAQGQVPSR